jgi:hypothetical protein
LISLLVIRGALHCGITDIQNDELLNEKNEKFGANAVFGHPTPQRSSSKSSSHKRVIEYQGYHFNDY